MKVLRRTFVVLSVLLVSTLAVAETTDEPVIGIVGRTDCGGFWRYDFNYETVESDGFGFGIDVKRNQKYLQGRATARVNIDAFLAGRKLMEAEGYINGRKIVKE